MANPSYETNVKSEFSAAAPPPYTGQPASQGFSNQHATTHTVIFASPVLGPNPATIQCPTCKQQVVSQIEYENGSLTWLGIVGCLVFGCWLGCCLIPTCIDDMKDVQHTCPNCKTYLGRYRRM